MFRLHFRANFENTHKNFPVANAEEVFGTLRDSLSFMIDSKCVRKASKFLKQNAGKMGKTFLQLFY